MSGLSQEHLNTYEKRYSPTCTNGHLSTAATSLQRPIFWWTVHTSTLVGGSREGVRGAGGPGPPLIFRPKWGPKGRKNVLLFTSQSIEKSEGKSQLHAYYGKGGEGGGINTATTQPLAFLFPNHVQFFYSPFYALHVQRKIQENRTISEPRGSSDTFVLCISHPTCLTDKLICIL